LFKNIAVAIITPTHTKKSFEMGLGLAKKLDANLSVTKSLQNFIFLKQNQTKKLRKNRLQRSKKS
jgi:hypothetical protein